MAKPIKPIISPTMLDRLDPAEVNGFWLPMYDFCCRCGAWIILRYERGWVALDDDLLRLPHRCKK